MPKPRKWWRIPAGLLGHRSRRRRPATRTDRRAASRTLVGHQSLEVAPDELARGNLAAQREEVVRLYNVIDNGARHSVHVYDEAGERILLDLPHNRHDPRSRREQDGSSQ